MSSLVRVFPFVTARLITSVLLMTDTENWSEGKTMFISGNTGASSAVVAVPGLSPLVSYALRVRAENEVGKSDYSKEIAVTTTIEGMSTQLLLPLHQEETGDASETISSH